MKKPDELQRENEALRERITRLSAAILRISASLDLNTVLQEAVESACALTGARYGGITTLDAEGRAQDFVTAGITPDEHRQLATWPDGRRLFEGFQHLPAPLRVRDLPAYIRSLGISSTLLSDLMPTKTLQGTPMRHRGAHVGNFFLGDKVGGQEFTSEDEEVLVLFAAQAATAIANARTHQDERRARADLEALIETSPVGVAVFDARTGAPVSFNREARRIVEGLRTPGRPPEELLSVVTCHRADGREISLAELPLVQQFNDSPETVRAEEMVLSVPDGRNVKMLVNAHATPFRGRCGRVDDRHPAGPGAAGGVGADADRVPGHGEPRAAGPADLHQGLDGHRAGRLVAPPPGRDAPVLPHRRRAGRPHARPHQRPARCRAHRDGHAVGDSGGGGRGGLVDQARNTFLSSGGRHAVRIDLPPDLPRVMADGPRVVQVLNNLFSNAARHAPETTPIRVVAVPDGVHVAVSVSDEGRGVPPEQLPHLFRKHAGLGGDDRERGGGRYGLGLAICKGLVEAHGGRIRAESAGAGLGMQVTFTIPVVDEAHGDVTAVASSRARSPHQTQEQTRVLVVDDDPQTLRYVRDALSADGFAPIVTGDPRELVALLQTHRPQLVLLDLMLPGTDGIELLEHIPELADRPVIFISGYGRDETIARALELGAADYIVKPFSPTELTARVRAALRRRAEPDPFVLDDLVIHYEQRRVQVAGRPVQLTATEFDLLRVLAVNAGRVLTNEALLRQVWGGRDAGDAKLLRTFVKKIRRKLGDDAARPAYLFTERGVGYRMPAPSDS